MVFFKDKFKEHLKHHKDNMQGCTPMNINKEEFRNIKRKIVIFRIITMLIGIFIIMSIFHLAGFASIAFYIAILLLCTELTNIILYMSIEKKIMKPVKELREGVLKVANGDYSIRVENDVLNEIGTLIDEFNTMTAKLEEGERIKKEYEHNRKDLIANISHDLKTPITSINGYIDLIVEGELYEKEKLTKYLEVVQSNCEYMNKLIDDLFLFSKLDMQKVDFEFNKIDISSYIEDIVSEFLFTFEEEGLEFSYSDELSDRKAVNVDAKRLYRSIRNIIGNAKKYGGENLIVKVRLYNDEDNIYLSIRDNGAGISDENLKNIFDRFYRVDKERTKNLMSTGLGLAIAKEIVDAHKGDIFVESELGFGSKFTIKLPIIKEN